MSAPLIDNKATSKPSRRTTKSSSNASLIASKLTSRTTNPSARNYS